MELIIILDFINTISREIVIAYSVLSATSLIFLILGEYINEKIISRQKILKYLMASMIPGMNVIISFLGIFMILISLQDCFNDDASTPESIQRQKQRENNVFAFLEYKGINITELDDYIDSRNLMGKMIDKIQ